MKKFIFTLLCLALASSTYAATITVDDNWPVDFNNIQTGINDSNDGGIIVVGPVTYQPDRDPTHPNDTYTSMNRYATLQLISEGEVTVYYDYVENGQLKGGATTILLPEVEPKALAAVSEWPVTTVIDNGPPNNRVDLVFLGDGYTDSELDTYATHVQNILDIFLAEEPLAAYASYFNVHRVDVVSNESGVDQPDYGIYRDTALDMTYNCNGTPRLLCVDVSKAFAAAENAPDIDQILVLANSTRYGGAGYPSAELATLAAAHIDAVEVALHEFGHSFGDLGDEYYSYGTTYTEPEPSWPNISIYDAGEQLAFQTKWYRWLDLPNVDTFEGAYYHQYGIYRPTDHSKMFQLDEPFEEVNNEQFVINFYKLVSPIDDATPLSQELWPTDTTFSVTPLEPTDHALDVQWSVDGIDVPGATGPTFTLYLTSLPKGSHRVAVSVVDNTPLVRDESARATWLTDVRQWQIKGPIQAAVDASVDGDTIIVAEGTYRENINFKGKSLILRSANPDDAAVVAATIIDGSIEEKSVVTFAGGEDANCLLSGFTITGGYGTWTELSGGFDYYWGGGIYCIDASPTITNNVIIGNNGLNEYENVYLFGGGIGCDSSSAVIERNIIMDNTADYGGGIMCSRSNAKITNCTISGNSASAFGGGVYTASSDSIISNCTITGNKAGGYGGGILCKSLSPIINNCILWSNSALVSGDEIYAIGGIIPDVNYCDIEGGWPGSTNIYADPCFIDPGYWGDVNDVNIIVEPDDANAVWVEGDYHLQSQAGRWDPNNQSWVNDAITSRCVDAGNPGSDLGDEIEEPNNIRINMGAFGGTAEASKTPANWSLLGDLNNDGTVNGEDFAYTGADWQITATEQPGDLDRNGVVEFRDIKLLVQEWLEQTSWR